MADRVLMVRRINHGQSEIWFNTRPEDRRVVATNGIVYPMRTLCSAEETKVFYAAFDRGEAAVPESIVGELIATFGIDS